MQSKKRSGETKITSVSVSRDFQKIVEEHNLSPSEVYRRGIAVMLCDLGDIKYTTELNRKRSIFVNKFLKEMENQENINNLFEEILSFGKILEEARDEKSL